MSIIKVILDRMMTEPAFADAVFTDVEKTLAEYNLSAKEMDEFKDISRIEFESFADASPEVRKSMGRALGSSSPLLYHALTNNENI